MEVIAVSREDVVLQRPEDVHFLVHVFHTPTACPGAATAYLLRRIAYRAGAYAPGIQEQIFHELGYRLQCRRVATPTAAILDWVKAGRGYRGAMLPTNFKKIHPQPGAAGNEDKADDSVAHAVGVTMDRLDPKDRDEELVMIDPWPGVHGDGLERSKVPPELEAAHREKAFQALVYYWAGWS